MTPKKKLKLALAWAAGALVVYLLAITAYRFWTLREPLCAKITETHMTALMPYLDTYQPDRVDTASIRSLLAKVGRLDLLEDGWNRNLVIERLFKDGRPHYTIISLGRDGRRGPCCKPVIYNWDDDAVLSGNEWLQVWSISGKGSAKH